MKKKLLNDFFKDIKKYKIFNCKENSPVYSFIKNKKYLSLEEKIMANNMQTNMAFGALFLGTCFFSLNSPQIKTNTIEDKILEKTVIAETLEVNEIEVNFEKEEIIVNNENKFDIPDLKKIPNSNMFELNWDYKTPPEKFKKYYSDEYAGILPTQQEINEIENFYGIPENTIFYMALKESRYNLNAVSHKNAKGLVGFLEPTAEEFGLIVEVAVLDSEGKKTFDENNEIKTVKKSFINNGYASVDAAARYLLWLNGYINGKYAEISDPAKDDKGFDNLDYTLAAYNAGHRKVFIRSSNGFHQKRIPNYKETRNYISDISLLLDGNGYIVQKNDSLQKIAKMFDLEIETIVRNNFSINSNRNLKYGSVINIENNPEKEISLEVRKGFSMSKIARNTGINLTTLLTYNNLSKNDIIRIGDEIKLPPITKKEKNNRRHTI